MIKNYLKNIGPGPLIAAAFIGPGTVTVCTLAGAGFGFSLLWAMLLSVIATLILQEMSVRLGVVCKCSLAEVIKNEIKHPFLRTLAIILVFFAIVFGNAAYEAGNISGGVLGLQTLVGNPTIDYNGFSIRYLSLVVGFIAFIVLYLGNYKSLEKVLVSMVLLMSVSFLLTAIMTKPNVLEVLKGIMVPSISKANLLTVIALVGTTVVPYNLFLHSSLVKEKWHHSDDLKLARQDSMFAIILGGLISMGIIISAASIKQGTITNAIDLAQGLEPLFGGFAKYVLSVGLFSAGVTSAITAPLAASYVVSGCLGWKSNMKCNKFRSVWMVVLLLGVFFSSLGIKPIDVIRFAQVANGILLPVIASFLIWVVNRSTLLGIHKNSLVQNILAFVILGICLLLSLVTLNNVLHLNLIG